MISLARNLTLNLIIGLMEKLDWLLCSVISSSSLSTSTPTKSKSPSPSKRMLNDDRNLRQTLQGMLSKHNHHYQAMIDDDEEWNPMSTRVAITNCNGNDSRRMDQQQQQQQQPQVQHRKLQGDSCSSMQIAHQNHLQSLLQHAIQTMELLNCLSTIQSANNENCTQNSSSTLRHIWYNRTKMPCNLTDINEPMDDHHNRRRLFWLQLQCRCQIHFDTSKPFVQSPAFMVQRSS